jgi:hypothetical protein
MGSSGNGQETDDGEETRTEPGEAGERRDPGEVGGSDAGRSKESSSMLLAGVNHSVP